MSTADTTTEAFANTRPSCADALRDYAPIPRPATMNSNLGVWTYNDCARVLFDYQEEMFEAIRSETPADLVELNVRLLAKTAKAFDVMRSI